MMCRVPQVILTILGTLFIQEMATLSDAVGTAQTLRVIAAITKRKHRVRNISRSPILIASLRLFETSVVVAAVAFLATLQGALSSPGGLGSYDWRAAVTALGLGIASGFINALITLLNLYKQGLKGS